MLFGLPLITPVELFNDTFPGKAPDVIEYDKVAPASGSVALNVAILVYEPYSSLIVAIVPLAVFHAGEPPQSIALCNV